MTAKQLKAVELIIDGAPLQEVAEKLGIARQTVSIWRNQNPLFKGTVDRLLDEARDNMGRNLPLSSDYFLAQLRRIAASNDHAAALKACTFYFSLLDRRQHESGGSVAGEDPDLRGVRAHLKSSHLGGNESHYGNKDYL